MKIQYFILVLLFLTAVGCTDDGEQVICDFDNSPDQEEGFIDEDERDIMNDCSENKLQSLPEIKTNLIGTWKVIGFGAGWIATVPSPCGVLTVTEENMTLEYKDGRTDSTLVMSYEVVERTNDFYLETEPSFYALSISSFCKNIMFFDHTPLISYS